MRTRIRKSDPSVYTVYAALMCLIIVGIILALVLGSTTNHRRCVQTDNQTVVCGKPVTVR